MNNDPFIALSDKLMQHIRNRLFFQYRFLEPALYRLELVPQCVIPEGYGTDGIHLYYDSESFVRRYRENPIAELRRFLHTVFHCIYLHPFTPVKAKSDLWELACDITIEASILIQLGKFSMPGDEERLHVIQNIQKDVTLLTAQEVITYLRNHTTEPGKFRLLFSFDDHLWMNDVMYKKTKGDGDMDAHGPGKDENSKPINVNHESSESNCETNCTSKGQTSAHRGKNNGNNGCNDGGEKDKICLPSFKMMPGELMNRAEEWKEAARRISMDMKAFSGQGYGRGMIDQNIDYLTRDEMDYEDFLQQFALLEEVIQLDPDEFDYMYYTYGLSMPGKRKLFIEPLEYREAKRIREFVIAIDTSGSCAGNLVKKFLTKTYSILKSTESFSSRVSIHIIQCDAAVQDYKHIKDIKSLESYARNVKAKGLGGTDFRPVFEYVDELIKKHQITSLNGLIYFTDGYGTYPQLPTSYKTAFVFLDKYEERNVPHWAMRVYWKENDHEH